MNVSNTDSKDIIITSIDIVLLSPSFAMNIFSIALAEVYQEHCQISVMKDFFIIDIWDKVFKSGPSKICGKQPLKDLKLLKRTKSLQIFKVRLPQILLGPLLNILSHLLVPLNPLSTNPTKWSNKLEQFAANSQRIV